MPRILDMEGLHSGVHVPLLTELATMALRQIILGLRKRIVEFGGGQSTLWFASMRKDIISIEHDAAWAEAIVHAAEEAGLTERVFLHLVSEEDYLEPLAPLAEGSVDVVFIDGLDRMRPVAAKWAIKAVKSGGWIIIDDLQWNNSYSKECVKILSAGAQGFTISGTHEVQGNTLYKQTGFYKVK